MDLCVDPLANCSINSLIQDQLFQQSQNTTAASIASTEGVKLPITKRRPSGFGLGCARMENPYLERESRNSLRSLLTRMSRIPLTTLEARNEEMFSVSIRMCWMAMPK